MKREYKRYAWQSLMKVRDALQVICDCVDRDTPHSWIFDDELAQVSEEVDYRYKHNTTKGETE